jgi:hypothetical protein
MGPEHQHLLIVLARATHAISDDEHRKHIEQALEPLGVSHEHPKEEHVEED